jgi:tetratricopeptide (TPR) repeat protein
MFRDQRGFLCSHRGITCDVGSLMFIGTLFLLLTACESALMREFNHHMSANDIQSTQQLLDRELAADPNSAEANYLMGNLLTRQQQYSDANTYFERSFRISSVYREHINYLRERNYRTEFNTALDALHQEQFERASRYLNRAAEIFPERKDTYPVLGRTYRQLGQNGDAEQAYRTCISLEPAHYECGINLAEMLYRQHQYDEVINLTTILRDHHPEDWRSIQLLTDAYLKNGQFDEAESAFSDLRSYQSDLNYLRHFAFTLYNNDEFHRSERYLIMYLQSQPHDSDVLRTLSSMYLDSGNYELVIEAGKRLLSVEPNDRTVKAKMMVAYELLGDLDNHKAMQEALGIE